MKKFTIEVFVDDTWIEDGFDANPETIKDALISKCLPYARDGEVMVRVLGHKQVERVPAGAI